MSKNRKEKKMKINLYTVVCHIPSLGIASSYQVQGINKHTVKFCEKIKLRNEGHRLISVTKVNEN